MSLKARISGFFRRYMQPDHAHETLMAMAETSLRRKFDACAPHILDAVTDGQTLEIDLKRLGSHMIALSIHTDREAKIKTADEQLAEICARRGFRELQELASSRGLEVSYRIAPAKHGARPTRIFADVALAPFTPEVAKVAEMRERAPFWPCRRNYGLQPVTSQP